jgi:hypothetical protein
MVVDVFEDPAAIRTGSDVGANERRGRLEIVGEQRGANTFRRLALSSFSSIATPLPPSETAIGEPARCAGFCENARYARALPRKRQDVRADAHVDSDGTDHSAGERCAEGGTACPLASTTAHILRGRPRRRGTLETCVRCSRPCLNRRPEFTRTQQVSVLKRRCLKSMGSCLSLF